MKKCLRKKNDSFIILKGCLILLILLSYPRSVPAGANPASQRRLAILCSKEAQESGLSELLTVRMQELTGVELVERDMLQKVLDEVTLSMMFGADQSGNRIKAGALLKADILILLSLEEAEDKQKVRIIVSDCSTGARLRIGWVPFDDSKLGDTCDDIVKVVHETLERFRAGVKQIIGVSHFISRNLVHDYDYLQASYSYLLGNALSTLPGVAVIEIEEARSIRQENQLAGDKAINRIVPVFVEGEFKVQEALPEKQKKIDLIIRISDGSGAVNQIERKDLVMNKAAEFIIDEVAREILKLSEVPSGQMLDKEKQFLALIKNADEFSRLGSWENSTDLREAAVLIKPDSVKQRIKLIDEYDNEENLDEFRLPFEHLEYMIYSRLISMIQAVELSWKCLSDLNWKCLTNSRGMDVAVRKMFWEDFLLTVYTETLKLEPSTENPSIRQEELQKWYKILNSSISFRVGSGSVSYEKRDLDLYLHFHNNVVPDNIMPSWQFLDFLKTHANINWQREKLPWQDRLRDHIEYFTDEEFIIFATAMSNSKKSLCSFYGRYTLLLREYYLRKESNNEMSGLRDKTNLLLADMSRYWQSEKNNGLYKRTLEMLQKMSPAQPSQTEQKKLYSINKPHSISKQQPAAKKRAKLSILFKKTPMRLRTKSGSNPIDNKVWQPSNAPLSRSRQDQRLRYATKCGDSLDVIWSDAVVLIMKEKGILDEIFVDFEVHFSDLKWDGENIWIGTLNQGIWLLDTSGKVIAKIGEENGLPPAEKGLKLGSIEPGRILAVGSFGPHNRGWCGIVEFKDGKASVNVFHEAKRVLSETDNKEDFIKDPNLAFAPVWIYESPIEDKSSRKFFVGRCEKKYTGRSVLRYPLEIDVSDMNVSVSSNKMLKRRKYNPNIKYNGKGYVLESSRTTWTLRDPETQRRRNLVCQGELPSLVNFWDSAHYGLIGWKTVWTTGYTFYQIELTESVGRGMYFHTFGLEDENGLITGEELDLTNLDIEQNDGSSLYYKYNSVKSGGYFPLGTYSAERGGRRASWMSSEGVEPCVFEPIRVTENSPEHLVFKVKPREIESILYRGRVVNALSGKPMAGAFVVANHDADISEITHSQWDAMHKLTANPSLNDKALLPLHVTNHFTMSWITRTDRDGRFEFDGKNSIKPRNFAAIEEDFLCTVLPCGKSLGEFGPIKNNQVELQTMQLFPAAKIKIYPCIEVYNSGRPCIEATNVGVRTHFINVGNYYSKQASVFFNMYEGYSYGTEILRPWFKMNQTRTYHVPAGIKFKIEFSPTTDEWCIPEIPQTIKLKQGETLDLGRYVFEPAMKICIKAVDSAGKPAKGVAFRKIYDDDVSHHIEVYYTDESGKVIFNVVPHSKARFRFGIPGDDPSLKKEIAFEIGSREDADKEFIVQVPDNIAHHLAK